MDALLTERGRPCYTQAVHPLRVQIQDSSRVGDQASSAHWTGSCQRDEGYARGLIFASRCCIQALPKDILYVATQSFEEVFFFMPKSSFFSSRRLALLAMLTAGSIVLSRLCVIYLTPSLRLEFGSIPIFLAGLFFGPVSGAIVGGLADVLGATLSGVGYYPPLTLSALFIGLLAGLLRRWVLARPTFWKIWSLTLLADMLAKMLWTTYWLTVLYGTGFLPLLAVRVPLYFGVSLAEGFVVFRLVKSGAFRRFCQVQPLPQVIPSK